MTLASYITLLRILLVLPIILLTYFQTSFFNFLASDEREKFINRLIEITPNVKFDVYGINKVQPIWADSFYKSLSRSKMGINLSQGDPIKYYSSDRVSQLIGNGLLTFIDEKTFYRNFFNDDELCLKKLLNTIKMKMRE